MTNSNRREFLRQTILHALQDSLAAYDAVEGVRLDIAILFGSAARPLVKPASDLDVLLVFDSLPEGRREREDLFWPALEAADTRLRMLAVEGLDRSLSPLYRTTKDFLRWNPLYLDMATDHIILRDTSGTGAALLARVREWIVRSGTERVGKGSLWYWRIKGDPSVECDTAGLVRPRQEF
jgi:predicted nucleotidyltransferase